MDIIKYDNFYNLKLEDFIPDKENIRILDEWEFMNAIWHGESVGFTEWVQLTGDIKEKSISLDLNDLPNTSIHKIFSALKLNVRKGMAKDDIIKLFGQPENIESYVSDRVSFEYIIGLSEKYYLSLTITDNGGLIYLVTMNHSDTIKTLEQNTDTSARPGSSTTSGAA